MRRLPYSTDTWVNFKLLGLMGLTVAFVVGIGVCDLRERRVIEFSDWQAPLNHGDTVVFIPPVAGG